MNQQAKSAASALHSQRGDLACCQRPIEIPRDTQGILPHANRFTRDTLDTKYPSEKIFQPTSRTTVSILGSRIGSCQLSMNAFSSPSGSGDQPYVTYLAEHHDRIPCQTGNFTFQRNCVLYRTDIYTTYPVTLKAIAANCPASRGPRSLRIERSTSRARAVVNMPLIPAVFNPSIPAGNSAQSATPRNVILSQLPPEEYAVLAKHLVPVDLPLGKSLSEPNQPIEFLYFLNTGLISTDAITRDGEQVEVGLIGREGFAGLAALLDQPQMSHTVIMQGSGEGFRIRSAVVRNEFVRGGTLQKLVHTFAYLQLVQITQSVLCNRMHEVEARLARWLVSSADRVESEHLQLTQEFLSQMLGVQRSTVTVAAGELQRRGLIGYSRGRIHIIDRPGLISRACECYGTVNSSYDRLLKKDDSGNLTYTL
jgi:CRP-like cAMP-binding protein